MEKILSIIELSKKFPYKTNYLGRTLSYLHAVNNVSFDLYKNEILGLVGESGCGKSTLGKSIVRVEEPTGGNVVYHDGNKAINILGLKKNEFRSFKKKIRMVFQDPFTSLNPRLPVKDIISEPLKIHTTLSEVEINKSVFNIMERVGLDPNYMRRFPHSFSGGQRQRIAFARALIMKPDVLIADEPVSALDVSIQAQIINMILELTKELNLSIIFISHDLSVVRMISDRIAVMYYGQIVEIGYTNDIFKSPKHPYTEALLSAVPIINNKPLKNIKLDGALPNLTEPSKGCIFSSRCSYTKEFCLQNLPPIDNNDSKNHFSRCHYDLNLRGLL